MQERKKILCVEDEKDLRETISMILQSGGYDVIEASDGQDAFNKFQKDIPNLVLCDLNIPIMNGHELLKKIAEEKHEEFCHIPFIFLTALGQKHNYLESVKLGADEYLVKPLDADILLTTIKNKLAKIEKQQSVSEKKVANVYDKVSNLLPNEVEKSLQNIIKLSATFKKELLGSLVEKKYTDYASKIYMSALKLNAQLFEAFDKKKVSHIANDQSQYTKTEDIVSKLRNTENSDITFTIEENLPLLNLQNPGKLIEALNNYIKQHKLSKSENIKIDIFQDYLNNYIISIAANVILPIYSEELENQINSFNGEFTIQENEGTTYHVINIPHFLCEK